MQTNSRFFALLILFAAIFSSCNDQPADELLNSQVDYSSLIGTVEHRMASDEELAALPSPDERTSSRAASSCSLDSDIQCDQAPSEVVYFVESCTNYPKSWPPAGPVQSYYKGLSYYVDGDTDINLDQYEGDLQDHVDEIIAVTGPVAYITASVVYWPCAERQDNGGVIRYDVYE